MPLNRLRPSAGRLIALRTDDFHKVAPFTVTPIASDIWTFVGLPLAGRPRLPWRPGDERRPYSLKIKGCWCGRARASAVAKASAFAGLRRDKLAGQEIAGPRNATGLIGVPARNAQERVARGIWACRRKYRSLIAGDFMNTTAENRLQAGSYNRRKPRIRSHQRRASHD